MRKAATGILQPLLQMLFSAADRNDLTACGDDGLGGGKDEVDTFLVHEPRDKPEQRSSRQRKAEFFANIIRIGSLAFPIARVKRTDELGASPRIPTFVYAIEYAGKLVPVRAHAQHPVETAAEFARSDFARIGFADRCHMGCVNNPGL